MAPSTSNLASPRVLPPLCDRQRDQLIAAAVERLARPRQHAPRAAKVISRSAGPPRSGRGATAAAKSTPRRAGLGERLLGGGVVQRGQGGLAGDEGVGDVAAQGDHRSPGKTLAAWGQLYIPVPGLKNEQLTWRAPG